MFKRKTIGVGMLVVFLLLFGLSLNAYAAGKMAYVDLSATFDKYEKTKSFDDALSAVQAEKEKQLEQSANEIKAIEEKLSLLSEKEKAAKTKELDEKRKKFQATGTQIAQDLRKERDEKLKEILQDIEKVVQDYAQKNSYEFILNDRVLLYGAASADVTQDIIATLNSKYKAPATKK